MQFPHIGIDFWIECVKVAGLAGIKSLNLSDIGLSLDSSVQDIQLLVRTAGLAGIKKLGLSDNDLAAMTSFKDLETIVQAAGDVGIRDFDLSSNGYATLPVSGDLTEFNGILQTAGSSGIKVFHF